MPDREKVIKGLSICNCLTDICYEHDCPYYNGVKEICGEIEDVGYSSDDCMEKLHDDALAILKDQEATIEILIKDITFHNCNNCNRKDCESKPNAGQQVRSNCIYWLEGR